MTDMALHQFLFEVPGATVTGIALLLAAAGALVLLTMRTRRTGGVGRRPGRRSQRMAQARDAYRYAGEVAVAAARAERTVRRRHDQWQQAHAALDLAWQDFDAADRAVRRLAAAAALPVPTTDRTPAEYADRERHLHRAAMAAYWRRELTVRQLTDALANRNGWDPRRHPVEQELALRRMVRDERYRQYRSVGERERAAWQAVESARTAARCLRAEAIVAEAQAWRLRRWRPRVTGPVTAAAGGGATAAIGANGWQPA
ncbi:hypothetical protein O7623_11125 [Solwaraspora sp. WMMD791]|uniref:hypothetical protein n=1 Tax=Solwaraspora sp. WMMD791 TaxID=3016086 RepID=UPI002499DFF3|nr:hypothetical protein [Solwaraspora sp. WMMD791]WFE29696.1 hypothetical protein O7623_11125 [Solwaraspora sp. WMMD791]